MSENEQVKRRLTARQEQAALLVALGQLKDAEIARQTGTKYSTLRRWLEWPEFAGRVAELRRRSRARWRRGGLRTGRRGCSGSRICWTA